MHQFGGIRRGPGKAIRLSLEKKPKEKNNLHLWFLAPSKLKENLKVLKTRVTIFQGVGIVPKTYILGRQLVPNVM